MNALFLHIYLNLMIYSEQSSISMEHKHISCLIPVVLIIFLMSLGAANATPHKHKWSYLSSSHGKWKCSIHQWHCLSTATYLEKIDFHVMKLQSAYVILGYPWFFNKKPSLSIDWVNHSITFEINNCKHFIQCSKLPSHSLVSSKSLSEYSSSLIYSFNWSCGSILLF